MKAQHPFVVRRYKASFGVLDLGGHDEGLCLDVELPASSRKQAINRLRRCFKSKIRFSAVTAIKGTKREFSRYASVDIEEG